QVTRQIFRTAMMNNGPAKASGQTRHEVGRLLTKNADDSLDLPKRLGHRFSLIQEGLDRPQGRCESARIELVKLLAKGLLRGWGLQVAEGWIDAKAKRRGQARRQSLGV